MMDQRTLQRKQTGMVLVAVLWIVAMVAVIAGSFAYSMRMETRLATSTVERAQARALAEAGVAYALLWRLNPEAQKQWIPNGDPQDWEFGGSKIQIRVQDAAGRISLNNASPEVLRLVLMHLGVAETESDRLAAAIIDWRDPDDPPQPGGAERDEYRHAGRPGPKNAPFESPDELQQVLGMPRDVALRLGELTTTAVLTTGINPQCASPAVLQAVTGLEEAVITDYVRDRARAVKDGTPLPVLPLSPVKGSMSFSAEYSNAYHIAITVQIPNGTIVHSETVVSLQNPSPGHVVRELSWRVLPAVTVP